MRQRFAQWWWQRSRRARWFVVALAVVVAGVGITTGAMPQIVSRVVFHKQSGLWSELSQMGLRPGVVWSYGVAITNSSRGTIIVRAVTFPRGLPAHIQLLHEFSPLGGLAATPHPPLAGQILGAGASAMIGLERR